MTACVKCSSKDMLDQVQIIDTGAHMEEHDLSAKVYRDPEAFLLKGKVTTRLLARVCGSCGYTELYAENPAALAAAAKGQKQRKRLS